MSKNIHRPFVKERETKRYGVFTEQSSTLGPAMTVGSLHINKDVLAELDNPESIVISVARA
jgi:hypothetical protein